jgi:hypothetical protein
MRLIQFGERNDYGKEWYMTLLTTKRYSLLQAAVDYGEYGNWIEWPYLQISMGYGRLFSFLFSIGRLGFTFDIAGRNWRDELFYCQPNENKTNLD